MAIDYHASSIPCNDEYNTMANYASALCEMASRTKEYSFPEEFDIDRMINEVASDHTEAAILAFHGIDSDDMDAWIEENAAIAHWIIYVGGQLNPSNYPDLEQFIEDFEEE